MKTALILGAGIIGLSTALELASRGVAVTVLERGDAMREASWAAAGMLAANDPENPPQLSPLAHASLALYPEFLARIEQLSGHRIPLRTAHTLQLCAPGHTLPTGREIDLDEALQKIPGLASNPTGPLLWLDETSLDPRDLTRALPLAARAAGVRLEEHCPVTSIRTSAAGVTAETARGPSTADCLVACSGAWTHHLPSDANAISPPIHPIKGQMLSLRTTQPPALTTVLRSPAIYLVPRGDGRIILGATVEDVGFDRTIDPSATAWLLDRAAALWPPIRSAIVEDTWTGLRPGTLDGLPLIGPIAHNSLPHDDRVWLAAGHYRNGILLAPVTARLVADALLPAGDPLSLDLAPFQPARFRAALAATL